MDDNIRCQKEAVKDILRKKGSITQDEAREKVGTQRLSAIIWLLRHKDKWIIESKRKKGKTRYGHVCSFVEYILKEETVNE